MGIIPIPTGALLAVTSIGFVLQILRMGWRIYFCARVYGIPYALLVPVRIPWSNLINTLATLSALQRYALARWRKHPLVWLKTEHAYPNRQALNAYRRRLGEVLSDLQFLDAERLEAALTRRPDGQRIGEFLIAEALITWQQLYEALSLLTGYAFTEVDASELVPELARCLPRSLMQEASLQPVRCSGDSLLIAAAEIPDDALLEQVRRFTGRAPLFVLVTPANLVQLRTAAERPLALAL